MRIVLPLILAVSVVMPWAADAQSFAGRVVGVKDGDTIEVLREGRSVTVRLHGVDTPESGQPFGTRARQYTSDIVFDRTVTVNVRDTDRYGRTVGEVSLPDGTSLNASLVAAGLAWWYERYAPHDTQLRQLHAEARATKRGLWADARPVAPWAWRRGDRQGRTQAKAAPNRPPAGPRYDPHGPDRDCGDFRTHKEAQAFFEVAGPGDPHRLDRDGDGQACESL